MNWLADFKSFVQRGNVLELAIGVAVGTAFNKIVGSLVDDILMPPIGLFIGGVDFSHLHIQLTRISYLSYSEGENVTINYGNFINHVIHFLIIALSLFLVFRIADRLRGKKAANEQPTTMCPMCLSPIPKEAVRCPSCTSYLIRTTIRKQSN